MISNEKKEWAKETLRVRAGELGRVPKKEDFDVTTLSRIKAFLGPWPRALESAGLKEITKQKEPRSKRKSLGAKAKRKTEQKKPSRVKNERGKEE